MNIVGKKNIPDNAMKNSTKNNPSMILFELEKMFLLNFLAFFIKYIKANKIAVAKVTY